MCMCECKDEHTQPQSQAAKIPEDVDVWGPEGESSLAIVVHSTCLGGDGLHEEKTGTFISDSNGYLSWDKIQKMRRIYKPGQ